MSEYISRETGHRILRGWWDEFVGLLKRLREDGVSDTELVQPERALARFFAELVRKFGDFLPDYGSEAEMPRLAAHVAEEILEGDSPSLQQVEQLELGQFEIVEQMEVRFGEIMSRLSALAEEKRTLNAVGSRQPDPKLSPAEKDIVNVIRQAGHRLTQTQILNALSAEEKIPSVGTTKVTLAALVRHAILTHDGRADPPGYGLPEWRG